MARESKAQKISRLTVLIKILEELYPDAHCALIHSNPLELLVATILSAQCTDERVNLVTKNLFKKYKTVRHYAKASQEELEEDLKSINFYKNKSKAIRGMATILIDRHKGQVPKTMEELIELPGVGRKTANVVLGNAFDIQTGIVVDTHVGRLARRLGLTSKEDPVAVEVELMKLVPQQVWTKFSHLLIWHGRSLCKARRPLCALCDLVAHCPQKGVVLS